MSMSLQVMYLITETTSFDYDYYFNKHMQIVGETLGEHIQSTLVTKGIAGGPDVPVRLLPESRHLSGEVLTSLEGCCYASSKVFCRFQS